MSAPLPVPWLELVAHANGRTLFGERGVRDPDAPCDAFDPVDDIDWLGLRTVAPGNGRCAGDGHYLCKGCSDFKSLEPDNDERADSCQVPAERG